MKKFEIKAKVRIDRETLIRDYIVTATNHFTAEAKLRRKHHVINVLSVEEY